MVAKIGKKRRPGFEWFVVSKKSIYRVIIYTLTLLFFVGVAYGIKYWVETKPGSGFDGPSARFLKIEGRVTIKHTSNNTPIVATSDTKLEPGDTIQTSSDSSAVVEYADGSRYNI